MKKLLSIIVLSLLLGGNTHAAKPYKVSVIRANSLYIMIKIKRGFAKSSDERRLASLTKASSVASAHCKKYNKNAYWYKSGLWDLDQRPMGHLKYKFYCAKTPEDGLASFTKRDAGYESVIRNLSSPYRMSKYYNMTKYAGVNFSFNNAENFNREIINKKVSKKTKNLQALKKRQTQQASKEIAGEIEGLKNTCKKFGYKAGTEKFADCVKDLYVKQIDKQNQTTTTTSKPKRKIDPTVWDDLLKMGGISSGSSSSSSSGSTSTLKSTCYNTGEETGGMNKSCKYSCSGNIVTTTISSLEICPVKIQN